MSLQTCVACSTRYADGLDACPHCGSTEYAVEGVAVSRRLPSFVTVSCDGCGRGPWTVRLSGPLPGLIALPALFCASCGSQVQCPWPPVEDSMPKITTHGGATNARDTDPSPDVEASEPLVGAEADQGRPTPDEVQDETTPEVDEVQEVDEPEADSEADDADEEPDVDPYAGMTLAELRDAADKRGVPSYGSKAQITERLREADAS